MTFKQPHPRKRPGCGCSVLLVVLAIVPLYFSMFWGWASGAGSPANAERLKEASNWAIGLALGLVISACVVAIMGHRRKR